MVEMNTKMNRSGYRCAFLNCNSVTIGKIGSKETLFRFPKDTDRCKLWVEACNRKELNDKYPMTLYNSYRVCTKHFSNEMFLNYEKTRLRPHAIPSAIVDNIDNSMDNSMIIETSTDDIDVSACLQKHNSMDNVMIIEASTDGTDVSACLKKHSVNIDEENTSEHIKSCKTRNTDTSTQTRLSLSTMLRRKSTSGKKVKKVKAKVKKLENMLQKKGNVEINMDILDLAVDKFFPPATATFVKEQARLFQQNSKGKSSFR